MLRLTEKQVDILINVICEEIDSITDYINDGTFDDDQDEKDAAQTKVNELHSILCDLKEY